MSKPLSLGFSPCPNDCFIFDAMIHDKIDTEGLSFDAQLLDVEALNKKAFAEEIDVTKLSYHAFAYLTEKYTLLDAGSALGNNCGPLLITNHDFRFLIDKNWSAKDVVANQQSTINKLKIAIPGKYTTANFLFSLAFPEAINKVEMLFSDIEDAVLTGMVDAGLIIHENRFTYEQKGLKKIIDLGEYWEEMAHAPIPLGGIVVRKAFSDELKQKINRVLRKSVEYAFKNPKSSLPFVKQHAQEMSEEVMYKHIDLYVNKYSVDLGKEGKRAVQLLFDKAIEQNIIPKTSEKINL